MTIQDTIPYVPERQKHRWTLIEAKQTNYTILIYKGIMRSCSTIVITHFDNDQLNDIDDIMPNLYGFRIKFKR